jgi:hypothetical protein
MTENQKALQTHVRAMLSIRTVRKSGVSRCGGRVLAVGPSETSRVTPPNETVASNMPGVDKAIDSGDVVPKRFRATNLASSARMRLSTLLREGVTHYSA